MDEQRHHARQIKLLDNVSDARQIANDDALLRGAERAFFFHERATTFAENLLSWRLSFRRER